MLADVREAVRAGSPALLADLRAALRAAGIGAAVALLMGLLVLAGARDTGVRDALTFLALLIVTLAGFAAGASLLGAGRGRRG